MSPIQEFYANQTIFITGVTGFLGKLLVEKLLRTCPDLEKLYLLVRPKNNKSLDQRFKDIFSSNCFDRVKAIDPDFCKKIHLLSGDCDQPMLGLNNEAIEIIKNEVTCIIHVAANVRFDIDLKHAMFTNVRSVRDLLDLMKEMKKVRAFVYVSTAFSHCYRNETREEFYDVDVQPEKLLQMVEILDDRTLNVITPHILGKWPNTYVYTKALAETVIRNYKQSLPVTIVRPCIVISTMEEPLPGWIDNFHGVVGVILGSALGVLRTIHLDRDAVGMLVPADHVVNNIIAAAWSIEELKKESNSDVIPIYNIVPHESNTITWGWLTNNLQKYTFVYPLTDSVWYNYFHPSKYYAIYKIRSFVYHTLFSYLVDSILFVAGKAPLAVEKYRKIIKLIDLLSYFTTKNFNFKNDNALQLYKKLDDKDKKMFQFNTKEINWTKYVEICVVGGRVNLMNDSLDTLSKARRKMYFLAVLHYLFVALVLYFWYCLLSRAFKMFF